MDAWMLGHIEGKRAAAEHYERNIKGSFNPHQVETCLLVAHKTQSPARLALFRQVFDQKSLVPLLIKNQFTHEFSRHQYPQTAWWCLHRFPCPDLLRMLG
jgi:hypothetical protein